MGMVQEEKEFLSLPSLPEATALKTTDTKTVVAQPAPVVVKPEPSVEGTDQVDPWAGWFDSLPESPVEAVVQPESPVEVEIQLRHSFGGIEIVPELVETEVQPESPVETEVQLDSSTEAKVLESSVEIQVIQPEPTVKPAASLTKLRKSSYLVAFGTPMVKAAAVRTSKLAVTLKTAAPAKAATSGFKIANFGWLLIALVLA